MKTFLLFTCFILAAVTTAPAQELRGLCADTEVVKLACQMKKGSKILSVCASRDFDGSTGYLQYRYGKPGKVEMTYPAKKAYSREDFTFSRYTRPMMTLLDLTFTREGVTYDVYDRYSAEDGAQERAYGVEVTLPDGKIVDLPCGPAASSDLFSLEDAVPRPDEK